MIEISIEKKLIAPHGQMNLSVELNIQAGESLAIYGESGAGKTTVLRILAGLMMPEKGWIRSGEAIWLDTQKKTCLPPQHRSVGFVFQDYALFPNMTVLKNLQYALPKSSSSEIIDELLALTDLGGLADRKPATLSGGQRQRVALARALVRQPEILLLDEPLSALDRDMRRKLQNEIIKLQQRFGFTCILVSHDPAEIFKLAKRMIVLEQGKIIRAGGITDVFIGKKLSGKYKFEGEILQIQKDDVVYIVTVSIGHNIVKVIATDKEVHDLDIGDRVIVSSKAFNPVLIPLR